MDNSFVADRKRRERVDERRRAGLCALDGRKISALESPWGM